MYRMFDNYLTDFIVLLISIPFILWLDFNVDLVSNNKPEKDRWASPAMIAQLGSARGAPAGPIVEISTVSNSSCFS